MAASRGYLGFILIVLGGLIIVGPTLFVVLISVGYGIWDWAIGCVLLGGTLGGTAIYVGVRLLQGPNSTFVSPPPSHLPSHPIDNTLLADPAARAARAAARKPRHT